MLHAYDQRFDVTENLKNFCELNKAKQDLTSPGVASCCSWVSSCWSTALFLYFQKPKNFLRFFVLSNL